MKDKFNLRDLSDFTDKEKIEKFEQLYSSVKEYVDYINSEKFHPDNDFKHYLYEDLVRTISSNDFWDWYNNQV